MSDWAQRGRWVAASISIGVAILVSSCLNASDNSRQIEARAASQPGSAQGVIAGRLLAGSGSPSGESAPPVGVAGQEIDVVEVSSGSIIAKTISGADGSFRVSVPTGKHLLVSGAARQYFQVGPGEEVNLNLALPTS